MKRNILHFPKKITYYFLFSLNFFLKENKKLKSPFTMAGQPATNGAESDAAFGGDEYLGVADHPNGWSAH
jgi:hypothetical protein